MTRLINADAVYKILESCEIRKATIGNPLSDWEYGYTCGIERAESEIECAPTIDAIPIDWLKKKYPLTGVAGTESYFRTAHIVDELIKEWEAEKEM